MSESDLFRSVRKPDRRRAHLALRVTRWLVVLAIVAVLGIAGWLLWRATNTLDPLQLETFVLNETDPDAVTDEVGGTSTTLVVGVDRRADPPDDIAGETADPRGPAVTEAVYLLQDNPNRPGKVAITFPGDLAVDPPGVVGQTRFDRVQALGGPDLLLATVQQETGMPVDHYVEVDLAGVVPLVTAVGGVEVCLDQLDLGAEPTVADVAASPSPDAVPTESAAATEPASEPGSEEPVVESGDDVATGCQLLDGPAAAGFLSSRSDAGLDVEAQRRRLAEQHLLVADLMERLTRTSVLANPFRADAILDALPTAVASDVVVGLPGQVRIAGEAAEFDGSDLLVRVVPTQRLPDQELQQVQPEQAQALFAAVRSGTDLASVGTTTTRQIGPEDVSVVVVNGVGLEGLAGEVSAFLDQRDFVVGGALNPSDLDPRDDWDREQVVTVLRHVEGREDLVAILVDALGDLPLEVEPVAQLPPMPREITVEDPTVLLEVGSGWNQ